MTSAKTEKSKYDAIVAGHICLDVFPQFRLTGKPDLRDVFVPGRLIDMGPVAFSTGGAVSNTGLVMHKLGLKTQLMGKVGDDLFGQGIRSVLDEYGVSDSMTVVRGEQSSYSVVLVPGEVDRIFLHCPGANDTFGADDLNYDIVRQSRLFHFGYPPLMKRMFQNGGRELIEMYRRVKQTGATTSLDMAYPDAASPAGQVDWRTVLKGLLPFVDIFLPSLEEALFMLNRPRFDQLKAQAGAGGILERATVDDVVGLGDEILGMGSKVAVIKVGHRGVYVRTAGRAVIEQLGAAKVSDVGNWSNRQLWEEVFYVEKVASATGAGDSTIAGFLAGVLHDKTAEETLKIACCVGGQNVQAMDAVSGIHSWDETLAMITGWGKRREKITAAGWRYDEAGRLWRGPVDLK